MEGLLDSLCLKIVALIHHVKGFLDLIFTPLNYFGPTVAILAIAFVTVVLTKFLTKTIKTKRYKELQGKFEHWYHVRQEAVKWEDTKKARLLAKNIDHARLNKAYYDYFLEGFLLRLITLFLPLFSFLAYVNETYKADNLQKLFGREYVFKFTSYSGQEITVGSVFWFIVSVLFVYLAWFIVKTSYSKYVTSKKQNLMESAP
jgi:hypothetical protein